MTEALATIGLVLAVAAVLALMAAGAVPGSDPATPWYRPLASPSRRRCLHGEVLFAQRQGDGYVALDCLMELRAVTDRRLTDHRRVGDRKGREAVEPLHPVHLQASGAYLWGAGTSLADVVVGWVADGRRVPVEIVTEGANRGRLKARTEQSVAVLDLANAGDLDRQLARRSAAA